jgi:hypothetical protein
MLLSFVYLRNWSCGLKLDMYIFIEFVLLLLLLFIYSQTCIKRPPLGQRFDLIFGV